MATLVEKFGAATNVLNAGQSFKNPETWKNNAALMNAVTPLVAAIPVFTDLQITAAQQNAIVFGIVTALGLYNTYVHIGSSTKVGLPVKDQSAVSGN